MSDIVQRENESLRNFALPDGFSHITDNELAKNRIVYAVLSFVPLALLIYNPAWLYLPLGVFLSFVRPDVLTSDGQRLASLASVAFALIIAHALLYRIYMASCTIARPLDRMIDLPYLYPTVFNGETFRFEESSVVASYVQAAKNAFMKCELEDRTIKMFIGPATMGWIITLSTIVYLVILTRGMNIRSS
ncbi:hypothetical protein [Mesorhizobium sp. CAU 1741]|uniref:hypothetical protein n=1 Tax=Mesorhizobium sp. CAU 1741 TaxID=3140366 RepID=UPI00325B24B4